MNSCGVDVILTVLNQPRRRRLSVDSWLHQLIPDVGIDSTLWLSLPDDVRVKATLKVLILDFGY